MFKSVWWIGYSFSIGLGFITSTTLIPVSAIAQENSVLSIRAIQTRSFDTRDQKAMLRNILSTLQDMGFFIGRVDEKIGFVTATRLQDKITEITVTFRPYQQSILVRISARINNLPVDDNPAFYQNFFDHLAQASFLNANKIY